MMDTVVVELDPHTSERVRQLARAQGTTITTLVRSLITQLADSTEVMPDSLLGMFADEPTLLDQVVDVPTYERLAVVTSAGND